jgi:hypothetical protein
VQPSKEVFDVKTPMGKVSAGLVKLMDKDRWITGNGFILSQNLVAVPTTLLPNKEAIPANKRFLYYDPSAQKYMEGKFEKDGIYCAHSNLGLAVISVRDKLNIGGVLPAESVG